MSSKVFRFARLFKLTLNLSSYLLNLSSASKRLKMNKYVPIPFVSPAYGYVSLALVMHSNEGGPGPRYNMKEDPGSPTPDHAGGACKPPVPYAPLLISR